MKSYDLFKNIVFCLNHETAIKQTLNKLFHQSQSWAQWKTKDMLRAVKSMFCEFENERSIKENIIILCWQKLLHRKDHFAICLILLYANVVTSMLQMRMGSYKYQRAGMLSFNMLKFFFAAKRRNLTLLGWKMESLAILENQNQNFRARNLQEQQTLQRIKKLIMHKCGGRYTFNSNLLLQMHCLNFCS